VIEGNGVAAVHAYRPVHSVSDERGSFLEVAESPEVTVRAVRFHGDTKPLSISGDVLSAPT